MAESIVRGEEPAPARGTRNGVGSNVPNEEAAFLLALIDALPFSASVVDSSGRIAYASPSRAATAAPLVRDSEFSHAGRRYRVVTKIDIDEQRRIEEELFRRAYYDELTGLPNEALFRRAVGAMLETDESAPFAIGIVDVDDFSALNDSYGRDLCDSLLGKLTAKIRAALARDDLLARISGDRFAILLSGAENDRRALARLERVLARVKEPLFLDNLEIFVSATAGFALHPMHADRVEGLLQKAEGALARAKRGSRGEALGHQNGHASASSERARFDQQLRLAIRDRRIFCAYQPKYDFREGKIVGLEALMRWRDEKGAVQSPSELLQAANEAGLAEDLAWIIFEQVLLDADRVDARFGAGLSIGFNVTAKQAGNSEFMRSLTTAIAQSGRAEQFMIELTEEAFMLAGQFQKLVLPMLREVGARISIDDFGVGFSSLSKLAEITADELKVDRSFITDIHLKPRSQSVLRAIESVSGALGMKIVVEGVETQEELGYLLASTEIRVAQGFYFAKPIILEDSISASTTVAPRLLREPAPAPRATISERLREKTPTRIVERRIS